MNRFRLIDKVSIYLLDRNNCHITILYLDFKRCLYFLQGRVSLVLWGTLVKAGFLFCPYMIAALRNYLFIFNLYLYANS